MKPQPLVALSLAAGLSYPLAALVSLPPEVEIAWKGLGVGLLALAALAAPGRPLLAVVLGFGALGDVLLDIRFEAGMAAFGIGHIVAMRLYLRDRREAGPADRGVALALLAAGAILPSLLLPAGDARVIPFTVYSLLLCGMAASAWLSRFPRRLTGLGALMFVVSDALIAVRLGAPAAAAPALGLAIWLLYYLGQLAIFAGVRSRAVPSAPSPAA
ncbi:MAG: lysoplasmalogenase [Alphaproteobacteria bacterium]|nr:lysoplasmalogenase [Alphaproteobacteria bacterium]